MPTFTHTPVLLVPAVAESKSGSQHESAIRYPGKLSERSTPLTREADANQIYELLYRRLSFAMGLHCEATTTALRVAVTKGCYAKNDGTCVDYAGQDDFLVPDATTAYKLWVLVADNALHGGAAWPADLSTFVHVAEADTAAGAVTEVRDRRGYNSLRIAPVFADNGQTNQTTFVIDADNAGAAAAILAIYFNRAASAGGEYATLEWKEADSRFNLRALHTTGTLAKLNLLELLVSGTVLLDANGAAKVAAAVAGDGLGHAAGVLAVNVDGATVEVNADVLRVKDGGVSAAKLSEAVADKLMQASVPDSSGATPRTVTLQYKDIQGNNLAQVLIRRLRIAGSADGAPLATNATIAVGGVGSLVESLTATKDLVVKTNASGAVEIVVSDAVNETVYLCAGPPPYRGGMCDDSDCGTIVFE